MCFRRSIRRSSRASTFMKAMKSKAGRLLATLDPTFAAADVKQLKQQVADLRAQIARDEAQLNNQPFASPQETDPDAAKSAAVQKDYL